MAYVRMKDRPEAEQPTLDTVVVGSTISLKKKIKAKYVDPYDQIEKVVETPVIYFPAYTQTKRVERVVLSDELPFRKKQYPTMNDRLELEKEWAHEQKKAFPFYSFKCNQLYFAHLDLIIAATRRGKEGSR